MKKLMIGLIALVIVISIGAVQVFAAEAERRGCFTDRNEDGICDSRGQQCGRNFVDQDQDGICDRRGSQRGCGYGMQGRHHGNGRGRGCR